MAVTAQSMDAKAKKIASASSNNSESKSEDSSSATTINYKILQFTREWLLYIKLLIYL